MTIIKRTKNIISSKLQEQKENFLDPESEMQQAIENMYSAITDFEKSLASALADKKLTEIKIKELGEEQAAWLEKATRAVGAGQDDLARRALLKKKDLEHEIEVCNEFLKRATENFNYFKNELKESKESLQDLESKVKIIKHKKLMAKLGMGNDSAEEEDDSSLEAKFENLRKSSETKLSLDEEIKNLKTKLKK